MSPQECLLAPWQDEPSRTEEKGLLWFIPDAVALWRGSGKQRRPAKSMPHLVRKAQARREAFAKARFSKDKKVSVTAHLREKNRSGPVDILDFLVSQVQSKSARRREQLLKQNEVSNEHITYNRPSRTSSVPIIVRLCRREAILIMKTQEATSKKFKTVVNARL